MGAREDILAAIDASTKLLLRGDPTTDPAKDTHNDNLGQVRADMAAGFKAINDKLDALATKPAPDPTPTPGA